MSPNSEQAEQAKKDLIFVKKKIHKYHLEPPDETTKDKEKDAGKDKDASSVKENKDKDAAEKSDQDSASKQSSKDAAAKEDAPAAEKGK